MVYRHKGSSPLLLKAEDGFGGSDGRRFRNLTIFTALPLRIEPIGERFHRLPTLRGQYVSVRI